MTSAGLRSSLNKGQFRAGYRGSPDERFWRRVDMNPLHPDGCWEWIGAGIKRQGYGVFWSGEQQMLAHRYALTRVGANLSPAQEVNHRCRNKRCVRPDHLEALSREEHRMRDMDVHVASGRRLSRNGLPHGVVKNGTRFVAQKWIGPKKHYLGSFQDVGEAARAVERFCAAHGLFYAGEAIR